MLTILRWLVNTSEFLGGGFTFAQRTWRTYFGAIEVFTGYMLRP